ncbi:MAG: DUF6364 family protein [Pseudomonadota bacterium]
MQTKLTLRLDERLIREAKSLANRKGQSVSQIVANYFHSLKEKPAEKQTNLTPIVKSLKGALRGTPLDLKDYHRYLEEKYS